MNIFVPLRLVTREIHDEAANWNVINNEVVGPSEGDRIQFPQRSKPNGLGSPKRVLARLSVATQRISMAQEGTPVGRASSRKIFPVATLVNLADYPIRSNERSILMSYRAVIGRARAKLN